MRMELRHLRYFVAVAELLNFRRAAEELHIAQSPLSHQIKQLEEEIGADLFTRTKRRVRLTQAGKVFFREARDILERASIAAERARRGARGEVGSLTLGYLTSMANDSLVKIVKTFRRNFPDVGLVLNDLVPDSILKGLLDRTIDVGFMRGMFETENLCVTPVWHETLIAVLPKTHGLARRTQMSIHHLKDEGFIMVPDQGAMGWNDTIRAYCRSGGFTPKIVAEANQMQAVMWLVHAGLGVALLPASLQSMKRPNVVYRPLLDAPMVAGMMVWRRDDDSPIVSRFRELALKSISKSQSS